VLKQRIIACLPILNGLLVQSFGFRRFQPLGKAKIAAEFLDSWGVDEIVLTDIRASLHDRSSDIGLLRDVSKSCFVPLTVGGGIRSLSDASQVLKSGADKVVLNSSALQRPVLISEIAERFGEQSIVVSIDVVCSDDGEKLVSSHSGTKPHKISPIEWAVEVERLGAGEIMLRAVERDGSRIGYDLDLLTQVSSAISIPLIAAGGAGCPEHFREALSIPGVCAAAAGNFFQHTEHSVITLKSVLRKHCEVRIDTHAKYLESAVDERGRVKKKSDRILRELRFVHLEEEVL
jgi:cyclase